MTTISVWWSLRRSASRVRGNSDERVSTLLSVVAFAAVTALLLIVVGGVGAFRARELEPGASDFADLYVTFAYIAAGLLVVPLVTLGGAAARLIVARRDERLASLRLVGATNGQITVMTLCDAVAQSVVGAVAGLVGYFALIPVVAQVRFDGRAFALSELWVGVGALAVVCVAIVLVGALSAVVGLRRVMVTPLGVAQRHSGRPLRASRVIVLLVVLGGFVVVAGSPWATFAVLGGFVVAGLATLNVVGPFVVMLGARIVASQTRRVDTLLAARRVVDDPKTAWRSVGGVALATFIAGLASLIALAGQGNTSAAEDVFSTDIATGGYLTLAIAGVLAGISTGVMQAGRIMSRREQIRFSHIAGADQEQLLRAQMRETTLPMMIAVSLALSVSVLFLIPIVGIGVLQSVPVLMRFAVSVAAACSLVFAGAAACRGVVRSSMVLA